MNFEFAEQINPFLEVHDFTSALWVAETALRQLPETEFHAIIGKSFLQQVDELTGMVDKFYKKISKKMPVNALYFEMNEFDINTDEWYIYWIAYKKDGGLDLSDMEWLSDYSRTSMGQLGMILDGCEQLQQAFAADFKRGTEPESQHEREARDWCEQMILTRFMELMRATHLEAQKRALPWAKIPLYYTEHEYDFIVRSEN